MTAPPQAKAKARPDGGRNEAFTKVKAKPKPRDVSSEEDIQCPTCWQTFRGNADTLRRHENTDPTCLAWRDWLAHYAPPRSGEKKEEKPPTRAASAPARAASTPARAAGSTQAPAPQAAVVVAGEMEKKGAEKTEPKEDKKKAEKNERRDKKREKKTEKKKQKQRRPTPSPRSHSRTRARRRDRSGSSVDSQPGRGLKITRAGSRSIILTFS